MTKHNITKQQAVLELLQRRRKSKIESDQWITTKEAINLIGDYKLATTISILRKKGIDIEKKEIIVPTRYGTGKAPVTSYRLKEVM